MRQILYGLLFSALFWSCNERREEASSTTATVVTTPTVVASPDTVAPRPDSTNYYLVKTKDSIRKFKKHFTTVQQSIILSVNRIDADHLAKSDSMIVPGDLNRDILQYSPYPQSIPQLKDVKKIIFFSYPAQYFGAYELGQLVRSGPTNMGRKEYPTPTGLFYANWKAEKTKSTFNDEWELKWNFNIQNKEGVSWHQYAMPGYPASHSCLRLLESDAKYLYDWADQWEAKGEDKILAHGTPVIVFGSYPFGQQKPWFQLLSNPRAMDITVNELQSLAAPYLPDIKSQEQKRAAYKK
jgi:lipoprotein-anchoring transpeptidase ErfK/SrfK